MKAFRTMIRTELKLSLGGMGILIFAICIPVIITIIPGIVCDNKPAFGGVKYTFFEQSFGTISTIIICAEGVVDLPLVISEYRHRKILKRFKVTPVSPAMILAFQMVIYTIYSITSFILVYITSRLFSDFSFRGSLIRFFLTYILVIISVFSIGLMVGGAAKNARIASVVAGILYFPMLIFSGATLPYEVMPQALQKVTDLLPLAQRIELLKSASLNLTMDSSIVIKGVLCS